MLAEKTDSPDKIQDDESRKYIVAEQKYIVLHVAMRLFQVQGYGKVSFSDIAKQAGITKKELQSYFSSKQDICHHVIDSYLETQIAQFDAINQNNNPRQRLSLYLDSLVENTDNLIEMGCPMTNLYFDVRREEKSLADHAAKILQAQLDWIKLQFVVITRVENTMDLPERLYSAVHGISNLAQVTGKANLVRNQVNQLKSWIRSM